MANYTYFIISPGYDFGSHVTYPTGEKGNYIKFGDQSSVKKPAHAGLREQYLTHNPDIGVAAIMDSNVFSYPSLGTRLKNYIINTISINPVGSTEWFSIKADAAWKLFGAMQSWDNITLVNADEAKIKQIIYKIIGP
ncbi:MAG TPA: hypothetical protein VL574_15785 [Stellaceae bacterium]|jgi:hypothetical protein|nr:hypothetical protein [Stellaceae bacterium]